MSKYPNVEVQLTGENGNIYHLLAVCREEARKAGLPKAEIDAFITEAFKQRSYAEALETCQRWFRIS